MRLVARVGPTGGIILQSRSQLSRIDLKEFTRPGAAPRRQEDGRGGTAVGREGQTLDEFLIGIYGVGTRASWLPTPRSENGRLKVTVCRLVRMSMTIP